MTPGLKLDIVGFERSVEALIKSGAIAGSDPVKTVLRAEAGIILKTCAGRTKVATPEQATVRARVRSLHALDLNSKSDSHMSITAGAKASAGYGKVWRRIGRGADGMMRLQQTHAGGFSPLWRHYKDGDWRDIREGITDFISDINRRGPAAVKAIGLARQAWVQIADSLGIKLESVPGGGASPAALAKARDAIASNGRSYANGHGEQIGAAQEFIVRLINNYPKASAMKLDSVLVGVVNGRVKFFEKNMEKGVFSSAEKILRAYPGLRVTL
jgi:hypothetical protein